MREITGIGDTLKTTRILNLWVKEGLLEKVSESKKSTYYQKVGTKGVLNLFS